MSHKLAITGATGKSGSVFLEYLCRNSDSVNRKFPGGLVILTHRACGDIVEKGLFSAVDIVAGDLEDTEYLRSALKDVDTLVHIAGIHWSREVVDAAAACGLRRLICVHTTGIYSKYKAAGEEYRIIDKHVYDVCEQNGIILNILRPTMIYGTISDKNVATFIKMVDKLPVMPVVNGARYELRPVHYADLGKAYYDVLMNEDAVSLREDYEGSEIIKGKDYVLSGGEVLMLRDMLTCIGDKLGKKARFVSVPYPIAITGAVCLYGVTIGKIDMREKVQRLCEPRVYDHDAATNDWGYSPRTFTDGVANEVEEYRKQSMWKNVQ